MTRPVKPTLAEPAARRDAIVVGAGAAGSYLAWRLADAGLRVTVLEAGPAWTEQDLISSQLHARRLKWGGAPVLRGGDHPFPHNMATGWGLGGAALHHYAGWARLRPEDFALRSRYDRGLDWPLSYDDLRPHYDRIQAQVGMSGDAETEQGRPPGDPYPMPPLRTFAQNRLISRGFAALELPVSPAPMAINSEIYAGRPPCLYDGWCDAGCPIGALANPLATYLPKARAAGAEVLAEHPVLGLLSDGHGQIEGVRLRDATGTEHDLRGDRVILAASSVQNARLLLASRDAHPEGVGNEHDQVGRYFQCHAMATLHSLFDEPTEPHLGVSTGQQACYAGYDKVRPEQPEAFGSYHWVWGRAYKPNDLLGIAMTRPDLFGAALDDFMRRAVNHIAGLEAVVEGQALAENRIELTARSDTHGVPLARIVHRFSDATLALHRHALAEGEAVLKAAGAESVWAAPLAASHPLGGTVMGDDPRHSVADRFGRVHDQDRLWLAGGGLFPSIGGVSPTLTILALASHSADALLA